MKGLLVIIALCCVANACLALSIENGPVKVTHRNSGPRYDIDNDFVTIDKSRLTPVSSQPEQSRSTVTAVASDSSNGSKPEKEADSNDADQMPIGHVSIRRIFLVPMLRPTRPDWQADNNDEPARQEDQDSGPSMFAKPFWPFLTPARPAHPSRHLYGADEASRSPAASNGGGEREDEHSASDESPTMMMRPPSSSQNEPNPAMLDPFTMMIKKVQQALFSQLATQMLNPHDLSESASGAGEQQPPTEERPKLPVADGNLDRQPGTGVVKPTNETREDIIEIEGKKYMRKTVINRHVGDGIAFMFTRYVFVPLNETGQESATEHPSIPTTTTIGSTTTEEGDVSSTTMATTTKAAPTSSSETGPTDDRASMKPVEEITTTTTTIDPLPTTTVASTTKESIVNRVSDVLEKAAERLVERVSSAADSSTTTTTSKPAADS